MDGKPNTQISLYERANKRKVSHFLLDVIIKFVNLILGEGVLKSKDKLKSLAYNVINYRI